MIMILEMFLGFYKYKTNILQQRIYFLLMPFLIIYIFNVLVKENDHQM